MSNQPINHRTITFVDWGNGVRIRLSSKPSDIKKSIRKVMEMVAYRRAKIKATPGVPFGREGQEAVALITLMNLVADLTVTHPPEPK